MRKMSGKFEMQFNEKLLLQRVFDPSLNFCFNLNKVAFIERSIFNKNKQKLLTKHNLFRCISIVSKHFNSKSLNYEKAIIIHVQTC